MKRILVPTDFSEQALIAIKAAAQIARRNDSELYILHMIDLPADENDLEAHADASNPAKLLFLKKVHEKFRELKRSQILSGITIHEEVRFHKTFSGIVEYSKELEIDLIVMGSHGATGVKEIFIGSNTERVVRHSDVPVLVIKHELEDRNLSKFVFASDFSEDVKPAFSRFLDFIKPFNDSVDLLYVNTIRNFESTKKSSERLRNFITEFDMPEYSLNVYNDSTIEKGILNFSKDINADIIALATHQRSGLASMLNESISEDLVNHAFIPVITFKCK